MSTRVLLVYGHQLLSDGLAIMLKMHKEIELVGLSHRLEDASSLCTSLEPDVMVVGIDLKSSEDHQWIDSLLTTTKSPLVFLADNLKSIRQTRIKNLTDLSWVSSRSSLDDLLLAIRTAATGRSYQCARSREALLESPSASALEAREGLPPLAERESQVLRLIAQGYSSKEIARNLHIAPSTVEVHRRNIMRKVNLHKVADLTRYAIRHHLIPH
jgi:two-component system NarL family response regulator